jgi:hypothetical protein
VDRLAQLLGAGRELRVGRAVERAEERRVQAELAQLLHRPCARLGQADRVAQVAQGLDRRAAAREQLALGERAHGLDGARVADHAQRVEDRALLRRGPGQGLAQRVDGGARARAAEAQRHARRRGLGSSSVATESTAPERLKPCASSAVTSSSHRAWTSPGGYGP